MKEQTTSKFTSVLNSLNKANTDIVSQTLKQTDIQLKTSTLLQQLVYNQDVSQKLATQNKSKGISDISPLQLEIQKLGVLQEKHQIVQLKKEHNDAVTQPTNLSLNTNDGALADLITTQKNQSNAHALISDLNQKGLLQNIKLQSIEDALTASKIAITDGNADLSKLRTMYDNRTQTAAEQEEARREAERNKKALLITGDVNTTSKNKDKSSDKSNDKSDGIFSQIMTTMFGTGVGSILGGGGWLKKLKSVPKMARGKVLGATKGFFDSLFAGAGKAAVGKAGVGAQVARGVGPIGALLSTIMVGKDVWDITDAVTSEDVRKEFKMRDVAGVFGAGLLGVVGGMLAGPAGAAFGASVGNVLGEEVGKALENPELRDNMKSIMSNIEEQISKASGKEKERLEAQLAELTRIHDTEGLKLTKQHEKLSDLYKQRSDLREQIEEAKTKKDFKQVQSLLTNLQTVNSDITSTEGQLKKQEATVKEQAGQVSAKLKADQMGVVERLANANSWYSGMVESASQLVGGDTTITGDKQQALIQTSLDETKDDLRELKAKFVADYMESNMKDQERILYQLQQMAEGEKVSIPRNLRKLERYKGRTTFTKTELETQLKNKQSTFTKQFGEGGEMVNLNIMNLGDVMKQSGVSGSRKSSSSARLLILEINNLTKQLQATKSQPQIIDASVSNIDSSTNQVIAGGGKKLSGRSLNIQASPGWSHQNK